MANVAPAYGLLFGVLEKTILPKLRCARCGASVTLAELPHPARSQLIRSKRLALIGWFAIALPATALLVWWLLSRFAGLG